MISYGATSAEWDTFIKLAPQDVRPIVSDPRIKQASVSKITDPTKVPTIIRNGDEYMGLVGWKMLKPTPDNYQEWREQPAYGISLVGKTFRAIDIDIDDEAVADGVSEIIRSIVGELPTRRRKRSSRRLMIYRLDPEVTQVVKKKVIQTSKGVVELLFDNQHFVVAGTHKSGERLYWEQGLPDDAPEVSIDQIREIIQCITNEYGALSGDSEVEFSSTEEYKRHKSQINMEDPELKAVVGSKFFKAYLHDGSVAVTCPWQHLHESTEGKDDGNITATVYFPRGLGGRDESGFKCMHASHGEKTVYDFRNAIGYVTEHFEPLEVIEAPKQPIFTGSSRGGVPSTIPNLKVALENGSWLGYEVRFDEFQSCVQIQDFKSEWRAFKDTDYTRISLALIERAGFASVRKDILKDVVHLIAEENVWDSAIDWLAALKWDGEKRIEKISTTVLKTNGSEYSQAVVEYLFTALAARVLRPGAKADMVPVLIGGQGTRKTSFVQFLVPEHSGWHTALNLESREADSHRIAIGKLVAEIPELRGLYSKAEEHIKAWITKNEDSWVPKYMENAVTYKRRFVMIGTSNEENFLSDTSGNRRWLPLRVCVNGGVINTQFIKDNLEQIWAEAKEMYSLHGIMWDKAERLARAELHKHLKKDIWSAHVARWIEEHKLYEFTTDEILQLAINIPLVSMNAKTQGRMEAVLSHLGYVKNIETGQWNNPLL